MSPQISAHYDEKYFEGQAAIGAFGGWANQGKFATYISRDSRVLDFGCGGGFLLQQLACGTKVGVEVNAAAAAVARRNGIEVFPTAQDVPDNYVDVIISNNALEHTLEPLAELRILHGKIAAGGTVIFVVSCESIARAFRPADPHQHLYSWSPMCLGNLFTEAGFVVIESRPYIHKWPPGYALVAKLGRPVFDVVCRIYGRIERSWFQVRIVARKPDGSGALP